MARMVPRLRDGTLDIAVVVADVDEVRDDEFNCVRVQRPPQCIVVREGYLVLAKLTAKALAGLEQQCFALLSGFVSE